MERQWLRTGLSPEEFWRSSLRQVFQVLRADRDRERSRWEHTLSIVAKIHNVNARKRGDMVDPTKMIEQMFGKTEAMAQAKHDENIIDKFRMLALQTGGRDYRKQKPS